MPGTWSDGGPEWPDHWHWETQGERHHSPIVWAALSWAVILGMVLYLAWEWLR